MTLLSCAALSPKSAQAARQIPASQIRDALPCKPFLEWMIDSGGKLDIQDISSLEREAAFASMDMRFPPHQAGTLWLRFTLGPRAPENRQATLLLDMGNSIPGAPLLFAPKNNALADTAKWQEILPSQQSMFLLPEAEATPQTMYLRLDGLPSPWFAPMLRTPHNAATTPERMIPPAILVALGVVMLLCLLRWLTERGQWRIWTGLYTGATLAYAVYGMPATPGGMVAMRELPGVLAPGIALMLLPHVGRHLMQTRDKARVLDAQYLLLSLPGAVLALLPLVPGLAWTSYYLALWPLATVLFVPTSLGAWLAGLPGARRFLLACLVSMIGATVGILGMYAFVSSPLLPAGPLLGITLGALFIAGTAFPRDYEPETDMATLKTRETPEPEEPGLRLLPPGETAAPPSAETTQPLAMPPAAPTPLLSVRDAESSSILEGRLRPHLDALLRESAGIAACALPPAARQHAEALADSGRALASLLGNATPGLTLERSPAHTVFDLQQLLREAHDHIAGEAERKGLRVSWFMPPHLPQHYAGNAKGISQVIRLLLESSIRATQQGFVQLTVRRVPDSVNPGHLLFSINDSGSGMPPHARSSLALARAWELAGAKGGSMSVESGARGAAISFTLHLKPQSAPQMATDAATQAMRVIIVDELSSNRQLLAFFLEGLPCIVEEARNIEEAAQACRTERAALLLIDCDMPEAENIDALMAFLALESDREPPATPVLALASADGAWHSLDGMENVHRLAKPVTRSGLRETVQQLLPRRLTPPAPGTDFARHEGGAPGAELPLDLPPPMEYGPGFAPEEFIPLSLDPHVSPAPGTPDASPARAPHHYPAPVLSSRAPAHAATVIRPAPGASAYSAQYGYQHMEEWVGEPVPVQPHRSQPLREVAGPAYTVPYSAAIHHDAAEWVGEPVPIPQARRHTSLLRPFDKRAARPIEPEDAYLQEERHPASFSGPQQGGLLDWVDGARAAQAIPPRSPAYAQYSGMDEWVGEPTPMPRAAAAPVARMAAPALRSYSSPSVPRHHRPAAHAIPEPAHDGFIPLRLAGPPQAAPAPPERQAPPPEPVPLFPEDASLLGFILGRPSKHAQKSADGTPRSTGLVRAAKDLVNLVRPRADAPGAERKMRAQPAVEPPAHPPRSAVEQMRPLIPGLLSSLDEAMDDVRRAFSKADTLGVETAAARIATKADNYGLRVLARMARCVEMAAKAHDRDALTNILPDLETAVERNRIALQPKR